MSDCQLIHFPFSAGATQSLSVFSFIFLQAELTNSIVLTGFFSLFFIIFSTSSLRELILWWQFFSIPLRCLLPISTQAENSFKSSFLKAIAFESSTLSFSRSYFACIKDDIFLITPHLQSFFKFEFVFNQ